MRFLVVCTIFAYAVAGPTPEPGLPIGHRIEPTQPTISAGDINGAAIELQVEIGDKQVEIADNVRAAVDAEHQVHDKVTELQGQAINAEEEQAWRHVDAVKTVEARLDGAAANGASFIAKNIVRGGAYGNIGAYGAVPGPTISPNLSAYRGSPVSTIAPTFSVYGGAPVSTIAPNFGAYRGAPVSTIAPNFDAYRGAPASTIAPNISAYRGAPFSTIAPNFGAYRGAPVSTIAPNFGSYRGGSVSSFPQVASPIPPIVRPSVPISPLIGSNSLNSLSVQETAPVASVVSAPASFSSAPIDTEVEASAPIAYSAPIEYSYPDYSSYPVLSNPYVNGFDQEFYANYGLFK